MPGNLDYWYHVACCRFFWLIGAEVQSQIAELSETLPVTVENAKNKLNESALGKRIVDQVTSPETVEKAKGVASTIFRSTFGIFGDLYIILILGIFLTVSPGTYKNGIVQLVPPRNQKKQTIF